MSPLEEAVLPVVGTGALALALELEAAGAGAEADGLLVLAAGALLAVELEVDAAGALAERDVSVLLDEAVRFPAQPTMTRDASTAVTAAAIPVRERIMSSPR